MGIVCHVICHFGVCHLSVVIFCVPFVIFCLSFQYIYIFFIFCLPSVFLLPFLFFYFFLLLLLCLPCVISFLPSDFCYFPFSFFCTMYVPCPLPSVIWWMFSACHLSYAICYVPSAPYACWKMYFCSFPLNPDWAIKHIVDDKYDEWW